MAPLAVYSKLLTLHVFLLFATTETAPLQAQSLAPRIRILKRADYEIGCAPTLPEGPYPPNLDMREVGSRLPDGSISVLGFNDGWGEREYLYTLTDLCDNAGCHCRGSEVACDNWDYILFVPEFYSHYLGLCLQKCECFEEDSNDSNADLQTSETLSDASSEFGSVSSDPSVNSYQKDWAAENAQKMKEIYSPAMYPNHTQNGRDMEHSTPAGSTRLPSRLNHGKPCLAGQAAGWVFQSLAARQCCPGYGFNALTASEAYSNYGVPIGYIVAGVTGVGICLKKVPR